MRAGTEIPGHLVVALVLMLLTGCMTRSPRIEVDRQADGSYRIEVLRCGWDQGPLRDELRNDLDIEARRRCPRGRRWLRGPEYDNAYLGTAVLGECPATRAVATVLCENEE